MSDPAVHHSMISEDHIDSTMNDDEDESMDESRQNDTNDHDLTGADEQSNQNNNYEEETNEVLITTRRSLRTNNKQIIKKPPSSEKKGTKRKSIPHSSQSQNKVKIPKYELIPVELVTKTIYYSDSKDQNVLDRSKLTCIPPREGLFGVGDLIWVKMQGYPWWPCMITIDPFTGIFSKIAGSSYKADRVYHVQYFGRKPYRGWTLIGMIMPFEGFEQFRNKIEEELKDVDKKRKVKIEAKYMVKNSILKTWNESVSEAEKALELSREDRVRLLNFNYTPEKSQKIIQNNSNNNNNNSNASKKTTEDIYDFDDDDDAFGNSSLPSGFVFRKRLPKGDYNVFYKQNIDEEAKKYPELSKSELNKKLKEKWNNLDEEMRSIFVDRKAIYEDESNMLVSKRSNFDDDYFNDESDYDYNDSDSDRNGFDLDQSGVGGDEKNNSFVSSTPNLIKFRKSKKSEKLFDKIKNDDSNTTTNTTNIVDNGDLKEKKTPTRRSRSGDKKSDLKTDENSTSNNNKSGTTISAFNKKSTIRTNQRKSDVVTPKTEIDSRKSSNIVTIANRLCVNFDNESDEAIQSDTSSENQASKSRKVKKQEKFCHQCGDEFKKDDQLVACSSECGRMYHLKCNKVTQMELIKDEDQQYICQECLTGKYKCFACGNPDDLDTRKCEDKRCNKYYHLTCIEHYPIRVNESANTFLCPLHRCINCHLLTMDDNEYRMNNRKLVKCIRCPVAYHANEVCIGAGTIRVSNNYIICQDHYEEFNTNRNNRHINVNYCMACIKVGNLICCERCPAAFHEECLEYNFDHEKSFYCSNCLLHNQLHYGDIVWVKLGQYRWWPGRISHPNEIPSNVLNLKFNDGEFPVYFFGSHDYYWVNKGRTFLYVEGDNKVLTSNLASKNSNKLKNSFKLAIKEASEAFEEWKQAKSAKDILTITNKPPPYQHIHSNRYFSSKNNNTQNESNIHVCDCTDKMENPCSDDSCLNRISLIECDPKHCPAGEKCQNQCFRKCEYVDCKPFRTTYAGWGLKTLQNIKKGQFVIEYCGEIIDEKECYKRLEKKSNNFYFLTLDKDNIIDAGPKGNLARFINHSCDPNCVTQKWMVSNSTRCGIFALKDIPADTELTFNYNLDCRGYEQTECKCNTAKCSGFIGGQRPMNNSTENGNQNNNKRITNGSKAKNGGGVANGKSNNNNKNSKKLNMNDDDDDTATTMHENMCFKCGEKDNLITCNHQSRCTKSYHLACLNLSTKPDSDWICPRHTCMKKLCTEPAFIFCSVCPNSLCKEHATMSDNLQLPDNQFLCGDHRSSDDEGLIVENELNGASE